MESKISRDSLKIKHILTQALESGHFSDAIKALQSHIIEHPSCIEAMRATALCLSHRSGQQTQQEEIVSDQNKAIALYKKIIKLEPKNPDAWYGIACVYSRRKDLARTVKYFKKAHALWGGQKKYLMYLGHFYRTHNQLKKAEYCYKEGIKGIRGHYGPSFAFATLYEEIGNTVQAKKYARQGITIYKRMPSRYHRSIRVRADIQRLKNIIDEKNKGSR